MTDIQALLEQMPLFENPHFAIEGRGFIDETPFKVLQQIMVQAARFGDIKPSCHVLETLDFFEVHLFDRAGIPLENSSLMLISNAIVETSVFKGEEGALPYREVIIKFKRAGGVETNDSSGDIL